MNLPGHRIVASLARESGAEDARTPNADAFSADSAASAKRLECVRFIGAFRPARNAHPWRSEAAPVDGRNACKKNEWALCQSLRAAESG